MGSGAAPKFEKNLNMGKVTSVFAWDGNLRDAMDKIEKIIIQLGENPNDPKLWEELKEERDRFLSRSKGYIYDVTGIIFEQNRTK
jgi:hypothetical protein